MEKRVSTRKEGCPRRAATLREDPSSKSSIPLFRILVWLDPLPPPSPGSQSAELVPEVWWRNKSQNSFRRVSSVQVRHPPLLSIMLWL